MDLLWKLSSAPKLFCVACLLSDNVKIQTVTSAMLDFGKLDGFKESVFIFCPECGSVRRIHDVQGLWTTTAKGFEKSSGCKIAT